MLFRSVSQSRYRKEKIDSYVAAYNAAVTETDDKKKQKLATIVYNLEKDPAISDFKRFDINLTDAANLTNNVSSKYKYVDRRIKRQELNNEFLNILTEEREALNKPTENFYTNVNNGVILGLDYLYDIFGSRTPNESQISQLSERTGVPVDEIKSILNEGTKGALTSTPYGIRSRGVLAGIATGVDDLLGNAYMGVNRILNGDDAAASNRTLSDRMNEYRTTGDKNKLVSATGEFNFNPFSISSQIGTGIGQFMRSSLVFRDPDVWQYEDLLSALS